MRRPRAFQRKFYVCPNMGVDFDPKTRYIMRMEKRKKNFWTGFALPFIAFWVFLWILILGVQFAFQI